MIVELIEYENYFTDQAGEVVLISLNENNIPGGVLTSTFTEKGEIIVGTGEGTYMALSPGEDGQFVRYNSAAPGGVDAGNPSVEVEDVTNYALNGGFDLAQEQTPGTLTTINDGAYAADLFKCYRENASLQYRRVSALGVSGLSSNYYGEFKKITNAGKVLICQPIEHVNTVRFRGRAVSFQVQLNSNAARTMKMAILELAAAGTADTIPAVVSSWNADTTDPTFGANLAVIGSPVTCEVGTAFLTFQFTGTFPADAKNLVMAIWSDSDVAANDTIGVAEWGLHYGDSQRTWNPRNWEAELMLVQKRYFKSYPLDTPPGTSSISGYLNWLAQATNVLRGVLQLGMWRNPTVTIYSYAGTVNKVGNTSGVDVGTTVTATGTEAGVHRVADSGTGFTAGQFYIFHFTADARL